MSEKPLDSLTKKIIRLYKNYGLNIANMSEDELLRIKKKYLKSGKIDDDLKLSEKYIDKFSEDIL